MVNWFRRHRRIQRKLSSAEFYGVLFWLTQAGVPLAFRKDSPTTFAELSYIWSTVALVVLAFRYLDSAKKMFAFPRNNSKTGVLIDQIIQLSFAFILTNLGLHVCMLWQVYTVTLSCLAILGLCYGAYTYSGSGLDAIKHILLFCGWLFIAHLTLILRSAGLLLASTLYACVLVLWTFNSQDTVRVILI